jgi:hypothetical protein
VAVNRPHPRRRSGSPDVWKVTEAQLPSKEGYQRHIECELSTLAQLISEALRDQSRRVHDVAGKAAVVLAAIEGAFRLGMSAPGSTPRGFASRTIKGMADALIRAEPPARKTT